MFMYCMLCIEKKYRKITSQNNSDLIDEIGTNSNCNDTIRSN